MEWTKDFSDIEVSVVVYYKKYKYIKLWKEVKHAKWTVKKPNLTHYFIEFPGGLQLGIHLPAKITNWLEGHRS